jgi:hypothetical protein
LRRYYQDATEKISNLGIDNNKNKGSSKLKPEVPTFFKEKVLSPGTESIYFFKSSIGEERNQ